MKRLALLFAVLLCCSTASNSDTPKRPRITGIAGATLIATDLGATKTFYSKFLESDQPCLWCGDPKLPVFFTFNDQYVLLEPSLSKGTSNFLEEVTFRTDDIPALRSYLRSQNVNVTPPRVKDLPDDHLVAIDPEGRHIAFTDRETASPSLAEGRPVMRIIHAGFVVHDRVGTDHFYKDILGFRPYWHGGMKNDKDDWVAMQVPDGTDWVEYMLNIPLDADKKLLGIMNHIAIGVPDIESAAYRIRKAGVTLPEEPQIGRDGKWQLNVYDPDFTRIEFMEFTPVQKPCCSEFTGPHPGPQPASKAPAKP